MFSTMNYRDFIQPLQIKKSSPQLPELHAPEPGHSLGSLLMFTVLIH